MEKHSKSYAPDSRVMQHSINIHCSAHLRMVPVRVIGMGKSPRHCHFVLAKQREFFSGFRTLLKDLGIKDHKGLGHPQEEQGEPDYSKEEDISLWTDRYERYEGEKARIGLVFGKDGIFLNIDFDTDRQDEITALVMKFCMFDKD